MLSFLPCAWVIWASLTTSKSEAERLAKQLNVNKIKIIGATKKAPTPPPATTTPTAAAASAATPTPPVPAPSTTVTQKSAMPARLVPCTEVGEFTGDAAAKFERRIAKLVSDDHMVRQISQKVATYMVYMPPQGSRAAADKKAQELKDLGVTQFFIIKDDPKMRWGISLGVFKSQASAKRHLANLQKRGVRTAQGGRAQRGR